MKYLVTLTQSITVEAEDEEEAEEKAILMICHDPQLLTVGNMEIEVSQA
jgi:hypothetical protein